MSPQQQPDPMEVDNVIECLNTALELQHRSILQFTLASGSMFGLIESEDEAVAALHAVIPHTGQEPRSEALEHLMSP
jgi:hypothetical protein